MREYVRFSRNRFVNEWVGIFLDMVSYSLCALFCMILLCMYVFHFASVQGDSMMPTLQSGNRLLVNALDRNPEPGDIVIIIAKEAGLLHEDGTPYEADGLDKVIVKRVVAVAGQEVNIDASEGVLQVNGETAEEPYTMGLTVPPVQDASFSYPMTVPEGYVYVLGDNREVSMDSRYLQVGLVPLSEIEGKVIFRLQPLDRFGKVT